MNVISRIPIIEERPNIGNDEEALPTRTYTKNVDMLIYYWFFIIFTNLCLVIVVCFVLARVENIIEYKKNWRVNRPGQNYEFFLFVKAQLSCQKLKTLVLSM